MDYFKIEGKAYNVLVVDLKESFTITYTENSGRTLEEGAPMYLEPIGCFIGHTVKIQRKQGYEAEYDELYDLLLTPRRIDENHKGLMVDIAHKQDTISYEAYISNGERPLKKIDIKAKKLYWGEMTLNIVPVRAQRLPQ